MGHPTSTGKLFPAGTLAVAVGAVYVCTGLTWQLLVIGVAVYLYRQVPAWLNQEFTLGLDNAASRNVRTMPVRSRTESEGVLSSTKNDVSEEHQVAAVAKVTEETMAAPVVCETVRQAPVQADESGVNEGFAEQTCMRGTLLPRRRVGVGYGLWVLLSVFMAAYMSLDADGLFVNGVTITAEDNVSFTPEEWDLILEGKDVPVRLTKGAAPVGEVENHVSSFKDDEEVEDVEFTADVTWFHGNSSNVLSEDVVDIWKGMTFRNVDDEAAGESESASREIALLGGVPLPPITRQGRELMMQQRNDVGEYVGTQLWASILEAIVLMGSEPAYNRIHPSAASHWMWTGPVDAHDEPVIELDLPPHGRTPVYVSRLFVLMFGTARKIEALPEFRYPLACDKGMHGCVNPFHIESFTCSGTFEARVDIMKPHWHPLYVPGVEVHGKGLAFTEMGEVIASVIAGGDDNDLGSDDAPDAVTMYDSAETEKRERRGDRQARRKKRRAHREMIIYFQLEKDSWTEKVLFANRGIAAGSPLGNLLRQHGVRVPHIDPTRVFASVSFPFKDRATFKRLHRTLRLVLSFEPGVDTLRVTKRYDIAEYELANSVVNQAADVVLQNFSFWQAAVGCRRQWLCDNGYKDNLQRRRDRAGAACEEPNCSGGRPETEGTKADSNSSDAGAFKFQHGPKGGHGTGKRDKDRKKYGQMVRTMMNVFDVDATGLVEWGEFSTFARVAQIEHAAAHDERGKNLTTGDLRAFKRKLAGELGKEHAAIPWIVFRAWDTNDDKALSLTELENSALKACLLDEDDLSHGAEFPNDVNAIQSLCSAFWHCYSDDASSEASEECKNRDDEL